MQANEFDTYFGNEGETVYSQDYKETEKYKQFLQYLCDKGVALGIVKFLLALRKNEELPDSPIEALTDYFGAYNNQSNSEMAELQEQVEKLRVENKILAEEIETTAQEIERKKIEKEQAEAAARALEEEEAKKKAKKGAAPAPKKK